MKTDDLIKALSADAATRQPTVAEQAMWALPIAIGISALLFSALLGVRADIANVVSTWRFDAKIVLAALLALTALGLAMRVVRPGADTSTATMALAAVPLLLAASILVELMAMPPSTWMPRLIGYNARYCLTSIPVLSLAPLAALIWAMRNGAPESPARSGAIAGLVAGGIGAALYATHCTDDSPLFVAFWYSIAIAVTVGLGAVLGSRLLRW